MVFTFFALTIIHSMEQLPALSIELSSARKDRFPVNASHTSLPRYVTAGQTCSVLLFKSDHWANRARDIFPDIGSTDLARLFLPWRDGPYQVESQSPISKRAFIYMAIRPIDRSLSTWDGKEAAMQGQPIICCTFALDVAWLFGETWNKLWALYIILTITQRIVIIMLTQRSHKITCTLINF